jgi:hypothetical protein
MLRYITLIICWGLFSFTVHAQTPQQSRLHGYVGGPYKVAIADFDGDKLPDVLLGYHQLGVIAVWKGDGKGGLSLLKNNMLGDEDRKVNPNDQTWSLPQVHNISIADIDGDGLPDAVFGVGGNGKTKPGRVIVARNIGGGKFKIMVEFATPSEAKGVCFVDMDNDGVLDLLYSARGSGYKDDLKRGILYIRRGLDKWKFGPAIESDAGRSAYYVETADLNNDGFMDVMVPNEHDETVNYYINPGKDIFTYKTLPPRQVRASPIPNVRSHAINDVRAADLNGDGNQDLVTANLGTSTASIFLGNGDGTFQKDTQLSPGKNGAFLGVGDFDNDGDIDFVITHWTENFATVFLNNGDATFAPHKDYKTGVRNYGVDTADLNGDGHLDIVTANYIGLSTSVLIGVGNGTFKDAVTYDVGLRNLNGKWHDYKH